MCCFRNVLYFHKKLIFKRYLRNYFFNLYNFKKFWITKKVTKILNKTSDVPKSVSFPLIVEGKHYCKFQRDTLITSFTIAILWNCLIEYYPVIVYIWILENLCNNNIKFRNDSFIKMEIVNKLLKGIFFSYSIKYLDW